MEAQFTIRDTLRNFENWVNSYGAAHNPVYYPHGFAPNPGGDGLLMEHGSQFGSVCFIAFVVEAERLEITVSTRWKWDMHTGQWLTERDELNAYCTELVREIRLKWEPVNLTLTELYDQSFRMLEAGKKPKDVFDNFYLPNLPEWEQPKDASQKDDRHNAWKSAMSARRKKRKQGKG